MMIKAAFATVAAAALCAPAMAPATAAPAPAVSNVAFSVPMKNCHSLLLNVCDNSVQVPVQACGNNIGNNIGVGILGRGSAKGGNNKSKCKQTTKSKHKH